MKLVCVFYCGSCPNRIFKASWKQNCIGPDFWYKYLSVNVSVYAYVWR